MESASADVTGGENIRNEMNEDFEPPNILHPTINIVKTQDCGSRKTEAVGKRTNTRVYKKLFEANIATPQRKENLSTNNVTKIESVITEKTNAMQPAMKLYTVTDPPQVPTSGMPGIYFDPYRVPMHFSQQVDSTHSVEGQFPQAPPGYMVPLAGFFPNYQLSQQIDGQPSIWSPYSHYPASSQPWPTEQPGQIHIKNEESQEVGLALRPPGGVVTGGDKNLKRTASTRVQRVYKGAEDDGKSIGKGMVPTSPRPGPLPDITGLAGKERHLAMEHYRRDRLNAALLYLRQNIPGLKDGMRPASHGLSGHQKFTSPGQ